LFTWLKLNITVFIKLHHPEFAFKFDTCVTYIKYLKIVLSKFE